MTDADLHWQVSPNGMEDGKILHHLLQEAANAPDNNNDVEPDHEPELSNDLQLQNMIENYQNAVMQQHKKPASGDAKSSDQANGNRAVPSGGVGPQTMSHSQPCLFTVASGDHTSREQPASLHYTHSSDPRETSHESGAQNSGNAYSGPTVLLSTAEVNALRSENAFLKQQVELLNKKTKKLRQLELDYLKIEKDFEQVLAQKEKKDQLEKMAMMKMEQQLQALTLENEALQQKLQEPSAGTPGQASGSGPNAEQLNVILNELIPQNKELVAIKDRQKMEIDAQTATLEEQRNHIDMLEKALTNAQERLAAKDRQSLDAQAIVDKCSHLQKLLQDVTEEKRKLHEEHIGQKGQLEMELTQLKIQLDKERTKNGPPRHASMNSDEIMKMKSVMHRKDERIVQLENNMAEIDVRYREEIQRSDATHRSETQALLAKVRKLELDKAEKDRRIQELLDEKQRIHVQWADERRSLDHRVRLLEQDLRQLVAGGLQANGVPPQQQLHASLQPHQNFVTPVGQYRSLSQASIGDLPTTARARLFDEVDTMSRMEELRQKIEARRAHAAGWTAAHAIGVGRQQPRQNVIAPIHTRSASGGSPGDHRPLDQDFVLATKNGRYGSGSSVESAQSESAVGRNKQMMGLASHMPNSMTYEACEFPRRRYIADRAAGQVGPRGTPGFRSAFVGSATGPVTGRLRTPRDRSTENKRWSLTSTPLSSATSGASSDEVTPGEGVLHNSADVARDQRWNSTTVLDVNRERLLPPTGEKLMYANKGPNDVREGPSK